MIDRDTPDGPGISRRRLLIAGSVLTAVTLVGACRNGSGQVSAEQLPSTAPATEVTRGASTITLPETTPPATPETQVSPEKYPEHHVLAAIYFIGQPVKGARLGVDPTVSQWELDAVKDFGGYDKPYPQERDANGLPIGFKPKQNPYYVALPVAEFTPKVPGGLDTSTWQASPWAAEAQGLPQDASHPESLFKGRWVELTGATPDKKVYAQWLDDDPSKDGTPPDPSYVFGDGSQQPPNNSDGIAVGIGISPTAAFQLGISYEQFMGNVTWRFVDEVDVPDGPWKSFPLIDNKTDWVN